MKTLTHKKFLTPSKPRPVVTGVLTATGLQAAESLLAKTRAQANAVAHLADDYGIAGRTLPEGDVALLGPVGTEVAAVAAALAALRDQVGRLVRESRAAAPGVKS